MVEVYLSLVKGGTKVGAGWVLQKYLRIPQRICSMCWVCVNCMVCHCNLFQHDAKLQLGWFRYHWKWSWPYIAPHLLQFQYRKYGLYFLFRLKQTFITYKSNHRVSFPNYSYNFNGKFVNHERYKHFLMMS